MSGWTREMVEERDRGFITQPEVEAQAGTSRKPRAHPERDLEKACSDILQWDGWRLLKTDPVSDRSRAKGFGEKGMADTLFIRYLALPDKMAAFQLTSDHWKASAEVMWIEWKAPRGTASAAQRLWIAAERARGALVWLCGADFPATVDGFRRHYRDSGLARRKLI